MSQESEEPARVLANRHLYLCKRSVLEADAVQRLHWESEIRKVEERLRACPRSEATLALLQTLQPYIAQNIPSTEREAALHTWRFLEALFKPPTLHSRSPGQEEVLPEDLEGLIGLLRNLNEERRRKAITRILDFGSAAIPELEAALSRSASPLVKARILYLLARLGEVRLMTVCWQMHNDALTSEVRELLENSLLKMGQTLEKAPERIPWTELVFLYSSTRSGFPPLADQLLRAMTRLAKTAPTLELRMALPYLQSSWLRPLSTAQREARQAIEEATRTLADLPLPTDIQGATPDLPRPAESQTDSHGLPRPTLEEADSER